jgi:hypothetical protein
MPIILDIISFMILIILLGKNVDELRLRHYIYISFIVIAQLIIALFIIFNKERPPLI